MKAVRPRKVIGLANPLSHISVPSFNLVCWSNVSMIPRRARFRR